MGHGQDYYANYNVDDDEPGGRRHGRTSSSGFSGGKAVIFLIILGMLGFLFYKFGYPLIVKNRFIGMEYSLEELHTDSLNDLSAMVGTTKLGGSAVKSNDELLLEIMHRGTNGRYGKDGAQQAILFLTENYPNMDTELRQQYIRGIEAGYAKFADKQRRKLEMMRNYKHQTDPLTPFTGPIAVQYGFPRVDLSKYDVILAKEAKQADVTKEFDATDIDPFAEQKPAEKE